MASDDAQSVGGTEHETVGDEIEANPDTYVPEYLEGTSTMADGFGLHVLWVSGRCSCGYGDSGIAPNWKVPAEWGGGYMTRQCPECLGTVEYSDGWRRIDRFVPDYSDLKPCSVDTDTEQNGGDTDA